MFAHKFRYPPLDKEDECALWSASRSLDRGRSVADPSSWIGFTQSKRRAEGTLVSVTSKLRSEVCTDRNRQ